VVHLEDASAPFLFHWKAEQAAAEAAQYVGDFTKLVRLLQIPRIVLRPESSQTTIGQFTYQAAAILDAVEGMIRGPGDLSGLPKTWVQPTPHAIENILQRQEKLYPEMTLDQHIDMTARYFASAWARRALNLRNPTGRIGFSFTEPNGQGGARIHMRTLPSSMTQNHIAPWRAKGYFKMSEADGLAKPKLASWRDPLPLNKCSMTLTDGTVSVQVQTDYVVPT
jgi:hypothetical protein